MLLIISSFCILLASASGSPNAKVIEELVKNNVFGSVSDGILEDARLDVPQLVRKYNYPLEEHHVITPDGYILTLHRIPHGRNSNNQAGNKPAVLVMHGLLCSSADWVLTGPGVGLGYILAEEGFDVWLGNNRGNYYSRRHMILNPDDSNSTAFWNFSLDEMGNLDISSSIDYILRITQRPNLHYIGMSQGTTVYLILGSLRPEYSAKIASVHLLAPVAFNTANRNLLVDTVAPIVAGVVSWATENGFNEIFPKNELFAFIARRYCRDGAPTQRLCSIFLFMLGGWSESQHNATLLPVKLAHTPAGANLRQFAHLMQNLASNKFRRYDYGAIQNMLRYGQLQPPEYNLKNIKTPVFIHYSDGDSRTNYMDVQFLYDSLDTAKELIRVPDDNFNHIDFMWGKYAKDVLYDRIISEIRKIESSHR